MTYIVLDVETTGLPTLTINQQFYDPEKFPEKYYSSRLVSIAWLLYKEDGELLIYG